MHTVVLVEALIGGRADLDAQLSDPVRDYSVDGAKVSCSPAESAPDSLADAYARSCPGPIIELAQVLGSEGLTRAIRRWSLDQPPGIEIPSGASEWEMPSGDVDLEAALAAEALGQGSLVLSPLRAALMTAALGAGGEMPQPYLVWRVQDPDGAWRVVAPPDRAGTTLVVEDAVARELLDTWAIQDQGRVRSRTATAVAGEGMLHHVWYSGVTTVAGRVYVAVVLVEHAEDPEVAEAVGLALLSKALDR
jgi:peptidoglycan glycosyltransferase